MKIIVCSTSALKVGAVSNAVGRIWSGAHRIEIQSEYSTSGVPSQPFGDAQTLRGALNRLTEVAPRSPVGHYVVAIESGVAPRAGLFIDRAYVAVMDLDGRITVRSSRHVLVPFEIVTEAQKSGWRTTCGQLEAARTPGINPHDPHVAWSLGKTHRRAILADAVEETFRAALHLESSPGMSPSPTGQGARPGMSPSPMGQGASPEMPPSPTGLPPRSVA